jgi:hypothetical protein
MEEAAATRGKLSVEQEEVLVDLAIQLANRNLGLQPAALHEKALQLLHSTHPGGILGRSWVGRFLARHRDRLACHWSRPFDRLRAMSATPEAIDKYFAQYKSIVGETGEKLPPNRQFAFDETGILRGMGVRNRVISSHTNKAAKVNSGGSRELITFVPIISGDGELVTGMTVFPGKILRKDWVEKNPGGFAYVFFLFYMSPS